MVSQAAGLTRRPGAPMPQAPNFGNIGQRLDKGKGLTGKAQKKLTGMGYTEDQISRASQAGGKEAFQSSLTGMEKLPQTSIQPVNANPMLGGMFPYSPPNTSIQPWQQSNPTLDGERPIFDMGRPQSQWETPMQPANGGTSGKVPGMAPGMAYDDYMSKINNNEQVGYQKSPFDMSKINFGGGMPSMGGGRPIGMPSMGGGQPMRPQQPINRRPGRINTLRQGMR